MVQRRVIDVEKYDKRNRVSKPLAGNQLALALGQLPLKQNGERKMRQGGTLMLTGNRTWFAKEDIQLQLALLVPDVVVHGDANGADSVMEICCREAGIETKRCRADQTLDGTWPAAGKRRNTRMIKDHKPDQGLALGSLYKLESGETKLTGTGDAVSKMLKLGLVVRWIRYPGARHEDLTEMPKPDIGT